MSVSKIDPTKVAGDLNIYGSSEIFATHSRGGFTRSNYGAIDWDAAFTQCPYCQTIGQHACPKLDRARERIPLPVCSLCGIWYVEPGQDSCGICNG